MIYTIAVCEVKISWWWTEELSETCRVLFQKQIWEISASSWFYYKKVFRKAANYILYWNGVAEKCRKTFAVLYRFLAKFPFVCEGDTEVCPYTVSAPGIYRDCVRGRRVIIRPRIIYESTQVMRSKWSWIVTNIVGKEGRKESGSVWKVYHDIWRHRI